ncbi:DUF937 domain-containing protein [Roseibacillus persicicus]|uniref:DUF937 domain-containing protein n=1 Tax=Roseibacillus persicicus TaxID=454148 RepID=UPI00280E252E|nr:DUF937 domain-containing protein [Roseibacillus persicicus]MDQ8191338.1 DUF937 domain-containing protein [Roseibacillus persicicus]
MNILDTARSQLNADSLSGMADFLGIDPSVLPQLIDESLPALLAIFQKASAEPTKAVLIDQFLTQTDNSILDQPNEALAQYGPDLMKGGKSGLARLLGPQLTDYIAPLAKSTGLGEGKVASALGTLAPFVIALLGRETSNADGLQALLLEQEIAAPVPEAKVAVREKAPEKSYLPDPTKKKERRPFPKRKAILLVLVLSLVAALLFWLVSTGVIPLPTGVEPTPETTLPIPTPAAQSP